MSKKTERLTIAIDTETLEEVKAVAETKRMTLSNLIFWLIKDHLSEEM